MQCGVRCTSQLRSRSKNSGNHILNCMAITLRVHKKCWLVVGLSEVLLMKQSLTSFSSTEIGFWLVHPNKLRLHIWQGVSVMWCLYVAFMMEAFQSIISCPNLAWGQFLFPLVVVRELLESCACVCVCVCLCVRVCARVCVREHKQASLSALPCRQQLNEPSAHTCQYLLVNETPTHAHIVR